MPVHLSIGDQARADLKHPMQCKPHTGTCQESLQVTDRVAACRRQLPPAVCFLLDWDSQGHCVHRACLSAGGATCAGTLRRQTLGLAVWATNPSELELRGPASSCS